MPVSPFNKGIRTDRFEGYVHDLLVRYSHLFMNHSGDYLPRMISTIPGQFNRSGHGIDIMALDAKRRLWIIEVSRGSTHGAATVKELGPRKKGGPQMSPAWRTLKTDEFLKLPDAHEKLLILLDAAGMPEDDAKKLFRQKLDEHKVAVIVPDGCHVEGNGTGLMFGTDIYTFARA